MLAFVEGAVGDALQKFGIVAECSDVSPVDRLGVGIEVHELPTLSSRSEDVLEVGNVVTVEPGIYLGGEFGVRIEDLVVVEDGPPRVLTTFPKELTVVG